MERMGFGEPQDRQERQLQQSLASAIAEVLAET
jgi:hypothetical protein